MRESDMHDKETQAERRKNWIATSGAGKLLNLTLWDAVEKTDQNFKSKAKSGGFEFDSANAQWLIKQATELWGPCGDRWGFTHQKDLINGVDGTTQVWIEEVTVWYPTPSGDKGYVTQYGVAKFSYMTNGGKGYPKTDEQAPKKALTNGVSKALSLLGFSADLWLKYYEHPEYAHVVDEHFAEARESKRNSRTTAKMKRTLLDAGADTTRDEEVLCRYWSDGEHGCEFMYDDPDVAKAILNGQSEKSKTVPIRRQLTVANDLFEKEQ